MGNNNEVSEKVLVRRGRVDSVDLYEVKDNELDILENGQPDSIYLNFSIFLFSIAATSICALFTTTKFRSDLVQYSFLFVAIIGLLLGSFLLIIWYQKRKSITSIIKIIRSRIPPTDNSQQPFEGTTATTSTAFSVDNPPLPRG